MTRLPALALGTALSLITGPVMALSCLPPDATRTFNLAANSDDSFLVLLGDFTFTAPDLPDRDLSDARTEIATWVAHFTGKALTQDGFTQDFDSDILMALTCEQNWCGGVPAAGRALAYVQQTDDHGLVLPIGPCGGQHFADPSEEDVARITTCAAGGACGTE